MRVSNKEAGKWVERKQTFEGNSIFAEWCQREGGRLYVVYSYGRHFPMYIFDGAVSAGSVSAVSAGSASQGGIGGNNANQGNNAGVWLENTDKYSQSTSRHQTQTRPCQHNQTTIKLNTDQMKAVINLGGYAQYVLARGDQ